MSSAEGRKWVFQQTSPARLGPGLEGYQVVLTQAMVWGALPTASQLLRRWPGRDQDQAEQEKRDVSQSHDGNWLCAKETDAS